MQQEELFVCKSPIIYMSTVDDDGKPVQLVSAQLFIDRQREVAALAVGQYDAKENKLIPFDTVSFNNFHRIPSPDFGVAIVGNAIKSCVVNYLNVSIQRQEEPDELALHLSKYFDHVFTSDINDLVDDSFVGHVFKVRNELAHLIAYGILEEELERPIGKAGVLPAIEEQVPVTENITTPETVVNVDGDANIVDGEELTPEEGFRLSELMEQVKKSTSQPPIIEEGKTVAGMPIYKEPVYPTEPEVKSPRVTGKVIK